MNLQQIYKLDNASFLQIKNSKIIFMFHFYKAYAFDVNTLYMNALNEIKLLAMNYNNFSDYVTIEKTLNILVMND